MRKDAYTTCIDALREQAQREWSQRHNELAQHHIAGIHVGYDRAIQLLETLRLEAMAEARARQMNAELPSAVRDVLFVKGAVL